MGVSNFYGVKMLNSVYTGDPYWVQWGDKAIDILGARYGQGRYYSPDDPRYATGMPSPSLGPGPVLSPGAVSASGVQINWWSAALLGVVLGAFLLGKRGR
jgi:hypothetical protein